MDIAGLMTGIAGVALIAATLAKSETPEQRQRQIMGAIHACFALLLAIYIRITF